MTQSDSSGPSFCALCDLNLHLRPPRFSSRWRRIQAVSRTKWVPLRGEMRAIDSPRSSRKLHGAVDAGAGMAVQDQAAAPGKLGVWVAWAVICLVAALFVSKTVFHYYLNFNPQGLDVYWPRRWGLLVHISAGTLALALGPWQFWTGFRARLPQIHRWTGRLYVTSVTIGSIAGLYMAATTTFGWAFGLGLAMLALAWAGCTGVAYVAIRRGAVTVHRRWMIRSYVVTFAFVIFRVVTVMPFIAQIKPAGDVAVADAWGCWAVPLLITIFIQGLQDSRRLGRRG